MMLRGCRDRETHVFSGDKEYECLAQEKNKVARIFSCEKNATVKLSGHGGGQQEPFFIAAQRRHQGVLHKFKTPAAAAALPT